MSGSAIHIDVQAVRFIMDHVGSGSQHLKYGFSYAAGGPVGTVQPHLIAAEGMDRGGGQIADILVPSLDVIRNFTDIFIPGTGDFHLSVQIFLHFFQNSFLHLIAVLIYNLDAVIVKGIMAGSNHDTEIKIPAFCHIGYAGCGGHMKQIDIHASGT